MKLHRITAIGLAFTFAILWLASWARVWAADPSIVITSPADQGMVEGTITIEGTYAKTINGQPVHAATAFVYQAGSNEPAYQLGTTFASPFKFTWDTRKQKNDFWLVGVSVWDAQGQRLDVTTVGVNVKNDVTSPQAYFTLGTSSGDVISGVCTITGGATDDVALAEVDLFQGNNVLANFKIPQPGTKQYAIKYKWDTTQVPNGPADLKLVAYDAAGHVSPGYSGNKTWRDVQNPPPNNLNPAGVKITTPQNDATVHGTITAKGQVLNPAGVDTVYFAVQGVQNPATAKIKIGQPIQFKWKTGSEPDGDYWIHLWAYDKKNNELGGDMVLVTVKNAERAAAVMRAPKVGRVRITSPKAGDIVQGTVKVTAEASEELDTTHVGFQAGAVVLDNIWNEKPPFETTWDTTQFKNGSVGLSFVVYGTPQGAGAIDTIKVNVQNPSGAPAQAVPKKLQGLVEPESQKNEMMPEAPAEKFPSELGQPEESKEEQGIY